MPLQGKTLIKACLGLLLAVISVGALASGRSASGGTLRVGGSGVVSEVLTQLAPPFEAETGIALEVVPSLGSTGANAAAADRVLGLSVSQARPDGQGDRARPPGRRRLSHAVRPGDVAARAAELRRDEVALLYRADKPLWPDGMPILIVLRPVDESSDTFLGGLFPGMVKPCAPAQTHRPVARRHGPGQCGHGREDQRIADRHRPDAGHAEKRDLRFVAIDGVEPSLESLENGSYPYGRGIYVVVPSAVSSEAAAFVSVSRHAGDPIPAAKGRNSRR